MTRIILSTLLIIATLYSQAQDKTTLLYFFPFSVAKEVTTISETQNTKHKILNMATVEEMPKALCDSILVVAKYYLERKYGGKCEFKMEMKNGEVNPGALPQHLRYLPRTTFKRGLAHGKYDLYVRIDVMITPGGDNGVIRGRHSSTIKPMLTMHFAAYDKEKTKVWKNKVIIKDLAELRRTTYMYDYTIPAPEDSKNVKSEYETLNAQDVFNIYLLGMAKMFEADDPPATESE